MTEESLRESKRRATRAAIEEHATRLVAQDGLESVTVEDICHAAGISKRTFFNYVDGKETAIFGDPPRPPSPAQEEDFLAQPHEDLPAAVITLAFHQLSTGQCIDRSRRGIVMRRRKEIRQRHPELLFQRSTHVTHVYESLGDLLVRYLNKYPDTRLLPGPVESEAHTILALAASALQLGFLRWTRGEDTTMDALESECSAALKDLTLICESR